MVEDVRSGSHKPSRLLAGGKSMGGRIASQMVSKGINVDGLFFLGYPLHPPGRPVQMRDAHLYRIAKPMLFVSGTRDIFATRSLLETVVSKLGPRARVHWIEGGDHSFNTPEGKGAVSRTYQEVVRVLVDWAERPVEPMAG